MVVFAGFGRNSRSWTVPVYVLSRLDMLVMPDEQPVPDNGLAHSIPPPAPRWMGPIGGMPQAEGSEVGEANPGVVHDGQGQVDQDPIQLEEANNGVNEGSDIPNLSDQMELSPATADFATSGGLEISEPFSAEAADTEALVLTAEGVTV